MLLTAKEGLRRKRARWVGRRPRLVASLRPLQGRPIRHLLRAGPIEVGRTARFGGFTFGYSSRNTPQHPMADSTSRFGFVAFAETWNGRLAMLGFVIGLATELLTGQGILSQIGLG